MKLSISKKTFMILLWGYTKFLSPEKENKFLPYRGLTYTIASHLYGIIMVLLHSTCCITLQHQEDSHCSLEIIQLKIIHLQLFSSINIFVPWQLCLKNVTIK